MKSNPLIRLSKSSIGVLEKEAVMGVLDREFLGMGAEVQCFEALSQFLGDHSVWSMVRLLFILRCRLVISALEMKFWFNQWPMWLPFNNFGHTSQTCYCDVTRTHWLWIGAMLVGWLKTKAVMPVHYSGGMGKLDEIFEFAEKCNLRVIEDAAHAFGSSYKGRRIGSFGDVTCFSLME